MFHVYECQSLIERADEMQMLSATMRIIFFAISLRVQPLMHVQVLPLQTCLQPDHSGQAGE